MIYFFQENRVHRAYFGEAQIDRFLDKAECVDSRYPEEWIASVVTAFNPDCPKENEGLSICTDGRIFRDVLQSDPEALLGKRLNEKNGATFPSLLNIWMRQNDLSSSAIPPFPLQKSIFTPRLGKPSVGICSKRLLMPMFTLALRKALQKNIGNDSLRRRMLRAC